MYFFERGYEKLHFISEKKIDRQNKKTEDKHKADQKKNM
jgi:hypothetical protein